MLQREARRNLNTQALLGCPTPPILLGFTHLGPITLLHSCLCPCSQVCRTTHSARGGAELVEGPGRAGEGMAAPCPLPHAVGRGGWDRGPCIPERKTASDVRQ